MSRARDGCDRSKVTPDPVTSGTAGHDETDVTVTRSSVHGLLLFMRRVLGGVATGAVLAALANAMLFGSLFTSGPAESRLLFLSALCISVALCVITLVAWWNPRDEPPAEAARRRTSGTASSLV
jgi:hypothetical protein